MPLLTIATNISFLCLVYAALQPLSSSNLPMASLNSPQFTFSMMFDREDATVPQMFHVTGVGDIHVPVSLQVHALKTTIGFHETNNSCFRTWNG